VDAKIGNHFFGGLVDSFTAKASLCGFLVGEDLQSGQNLDGLLVINPFKTGPDENGKLVQEFCDSGFAD
jgi:hypothetical protein